MCLPSAMPDLYHMYVRSEKPLQACYGQWQDMILAGEPHFDTCATFQQSWVTEWRKMIARNQTSASARS